MPDAVSAVKEASFLSGWHQASAQINELAVLWQQPVHQACRYLSGLAEAPA